MLARSKRSNSAPKRYASEFNRACGMLGKPKAEVVNSFGGPNVANNHQYSYLLDTHTRIAVARVGYEMRMKRIAEIQCTSLVFELTHGIVVDVALNLLDNEAYYPEFQEFYDAGAFWDVLDAESIKPESVEVFEPEAICYRSERAEHVGDTGIAGADFDIELCAMLKGNVPFHIEGGYRQPAIVAMPTFDIGLDKWTADSFEMNPHFNWRNLKVFRIRTQSRGAANHSARRIVCPLSD